MKAEKFLSEKSARMLDSTRGGRGRKFDTRPMLVSKVFVDMRYVGKAPILDDPRSYSTAFLLANQRVRGIDFNEIGRWNFRYKRRIPKGWHQNVCDPNLKTNDPKRNVHHPLPNFSPADFRDFIRKTAEMWNIDLGSEWKSDLF